METISMNDVQNMDDASKVEIRLEECQTEYEIFMSDDFAKGFEKVVGFCRRDRGSDGGKSAVQLFCSILHKMRNSEKLTENEMDAITSLLDEPGFQSVANEFISKLSAGKTNMAKMHKFMNLMLDNSGKFKAKDRQAYFSNIAADTLLKKDQLNETVTLLDRNGYTGASEKIKTYGVMNYTKDGEEENRNPALDVCKSTGDNDELAKYLYTNGADMNFANKEGYSLSFATQARNKKIIKMLFGMDVDKYKEFGEDSKHQNDSFAMLLKSCKNYDDLNLVKYFLDEGWFEGQINKNSGKWADKYINAAKEIDKAADAIKGDDIAKKELRAIYRHVKELIEVAIAKEKRAAKERVKQEFAKLVDVRKIPIKETNEETEVKTETSIVS